MNPYRWLFILILFVMPCAPATAWATFIIHTRTAVDITLTGFDALNDLPLFQGQITEENPQEIVRRWGEKLTLAKTRSRKERRMNTLSSCSSL